MKSLRFSRSRAVSLWVCALAILLSASSASAESIAPGGTYSQDFDSMGTSTSLPDGWMVARSSSGGDVTAEVYATATASTTTEGTGTGTGHGIYNFGDASDTSDRGVGFLATGSGTKTGNLYLSLTATGPISGLTVSYDVECYRNNTRQFQFQLYYSTDSGTTWNDAGSSFLTKPATGAAGVCNPAETTSVSGQTLDVSLFAGDTILLCWSYTVSSGSTFTNAQGLGIDNVVIEAGESSLTTLDTPVVTATPEMDGLWLSWTAIANAYDYELQVLDPDGEQAGTWSFNHEQSASQWSGVHVEGLAEETEYTVRLRVLGDGTTYANSAWFEDTFSTIADPWRPEWTIGDPTPSPFVGTAFSFGVSAFRYIPGFDGTDPQTVAFDGLTPVPAGTQPAFANGVFSWTPGMDDDGDYVAAFSVQNDGGTYSTNVAFTVRGTTEKIVLFEETFAECVTIWGNNADFSASWADDDHAWVVDGAKRGMSGLRLGNKSVYNAAVTPTIHPQNDAAATVALSFLAAGWEAGGQMTVTVRDATTQNALFSQTISLAVFPDVNNPIPTTEGFAFGPYPVSVSGPFTVSFQRAAGDGRMGIDSVKVTQKVSTSLVDLDIPTGLAVVDGTLSTNSFSVAWNAVANTSSYGVEVYEAGGTDPVRSLAPTATSAAFAGLSDDTDYEVRVRAQGDTSLYNYSDWTNLVVHTVRSALHPTLTVGAWANACEAGKVYGVIENTATVSATLDDGITPVAVALSGVTPAPGSAPVLADGTLTWTPDASDEGKPFVLTFAMTPAEGVVYTTNLSFTVTALPALKAPTVTVDESSVTNADGKASGRAGLSWDSQYRATDYAVRAWTGSPNLAATATRVEEPFVDFHEGVRPVGWTFKCASTAYTDAGAPVKLEATGHWFGTFDLGGVVTNVAFRAGGHSAANGSSVLRVYGVGALSDEDFGDKDNWGEPLAEIAVSEFGTTDRDFSIPVAAALGVRRIAWQYTKDGGNVGVGSVVIEGKGFATPKFLPGWGPTPVSQGLDLSCTVTPTRAGRTNWAEVSVTDGTATYASVVKIVVPDANPVTLLILK